MKTQKKPRQKKRNGAGWNKNRSQGRKSHFTPSEVDFLIQTLVWEENWHDLALLTVAIDTALRACDLLKLKVEDVCYTTGQIRQKLPQQQQKTGRPVEPVLTPDTQKALAHWIDVSGKARDAYLFTRTKTGHNARPISRLHLSRLVKQWAQMLGHAPDDYACHSLRRTRGVEMYAAGERVADISRMYGHICEASTLYYLGITQARVTEMCLRYGRKIHFNRTRSNRRAGRPRPVRTRAASPDSDLLCLKAVKGVSP